MTQSRAAGLAGSPSTRQAQPALWLTLAIGVSFALIWSSAFSVAKILVAHAPPFSISAVRFFVAASLAIGLALALGQRLPQGRAAWRAIILIGLCQNTLYLGLFFTAMTRIPAGFAAIVASAMPLIVGALAPLVIQERLGAIKTAGLITGFLGVVWVMVGRITGGVDLLGLALAVLGVLALSIATLTIKRGDFGTGLLMVVGCQMLIGGLGCVPIALLAEDVTAFAITPAVLLAFAYQVVFPGIVATLLWFTLVKRISAAGASTFHFLNPIFGVAIAFVLLGEPVSAWDGLGVALVALGILIVNRPARG
jgi:drug/metabolite transporter (DMT)-like permease